MLGRDPGAGSTGTLQKKLMGKQKISRKMRLLPSQRALFRKLVIDPWAIGYISSGLALKSKQLVVFKLDGVTPSSDNVINGHYDLTRPLLMVVKGVPTSKMNHCQHIKIFKIDLIGISLHFNNQTKPLAKFQY